MPRKPRNFQIGHSYHITTRCNNREFKLSRRECREVFLYAIKKVSTKYNFRLYALCIMSNHVHYLIEPLQPEDLPKIMHYLNWYTAMCFNRMLKRTGHFWEKRYYCNGFPSSDRERALNTLRYIHGNPKAAKMRCGFFYDFSNYGSYECLTNDGLTQWHPAFLELANTLDQCAQKYKELCKKYKSKQKNSRKCHWGSKLLGGIVLSFDGRNSRSAKKKKKLSTPFDFPPTVMPDNEELAKVVSQFVVANRPN